VSDVGREGEGRGGGVEMVGGGSRAEWGFCGCDGGRGFRGRRAGGDFYGGGGVEGLEGRGRV